LNDKDGLPIRTNEIEHQGRAVSVTRLGEAIELVFSHRRGSSLQSDHQSIDDLVPCDAQKRATIVKTIPSAKDLMGTAADHRSTARRHAVSRTASCHSLLAESSYWLSGRCEGFSLLHHVGDEYSCFRFARFTARMRRFGRIWKPSPGLMVRVG
jgi:hypothetical protein